MEVIGTYAERKEQVAAFLKEKRAVSLATCVNNHAAVRTISFASRGLEIVFLTYRHNTKYRQIAANPSVALCRDSVQIEGTVEILGSPIDPKNATYAQALREKFPDSFDADARRLGMVIVRVAPRLVSVFRTTDGAHLVDTLDLVGQTLKTTDLSDSSDLKPSHAASPED